MPDEIKQASELFGRDIYYPKPSKPLKEHSDEELAKLSEAYDHYSNADALDGTPPEMTDDERQTFEAIGDEMARRLK